MTCAAVVHQGDPGEPAAAPVPRVVLVEAHLLESGGVRVTHEIARRLPALGVPTTLFVLQRPDAHSNHLHPSPEVDVDFASARPRRLRAALPLALVRLVRASRGAGVVVSGSEVGYGLLVGWVAARVVRRPFVILVQDSPGRAVRDWVPAALRRVTRWVHAHADLLVCVSDGVAEEVLAAGARTSRVRVVTPGIDVEQVVAAGVAPPHRSLASRPYTVAAGRLVPAKGFDVLVRAHAAASRPAGGQHLLIIGEGPERPALEALIDELGVRGSVALPGFVDDLQAHLARASLFVLSSRHEGMGGLVLLEAMAHQLPIIATDCPHGPRTLLRGGELGQLVQPEDVEALTAALRAHAADPGPLADRARHARARARDFGPDRWVEQVRVELLRVAATGSSRTGGRRRWS